MYKRQKYEQIMDKIEVTPEMRQRVLRNVEAEQAKQKKMCIRDRFRRVNAGAWDHRCMKGGLFMSRLQKSNTLYSHPFSKAYWRDAAAELKDTHMLVFAALMIALRLVMKQLAIPITPFLKINTCLLYTSRCV